MTETTSPAPIWLAAALVCLAGPLAHGHGAEPSQPDTERTIIFPDTATHRTLVVDLHTHSVFSDGHVWPRIRVGEALRDGLHAIAITEHLEYQPHLADIPHPDRNRAYAEAVTAAEGTGLIVIAGSEITREPPAGHINAVFINDANALLKVPNPPADAGDVIGYYREANAWPVAEAVAAANDQGAFVFWNHPFWSAQAPDGIARINRFHRRAAKRGQMHGIEVANGEEYSAGAFQIALDHDLTLIGTSDVHGLIDWDYEPHTGGHRPVTLVFATQASGAGIREALFARRTVVWFRNLLIGRADALDPLLASILSVTGVERVPETTLVDLTLANASDASLELRNTTGIRFSRHADRVTVPAHGSLTLRVKRPGASADVTDVALSFEVTNALTAPGEHPTIDLRATLAALPGP